MSIDQQAPVLASRQNHTGHYSHAGHAARKPETPYRWERRVSHPGLRVSFPSAIVAIDLAWKGRDILGVDRGGKVCPEARTQPVRQLSTASLRVLSRLPRVSAELGPYGRRVVSCVWVCVGVFGTKEAGNCLHNRQQVCV